MQYKIIVDKQSSANPSSEKKEYVIDIEELRVKGNVYDSLVITKDETYVMRRLELTEYHVLKELEKPIKQVLNEVNIELFEGDNYIYLLDMQGNKFTAEYIVKNDFTDLYVTTNEMNSAITQTAQQIELSVNQKLTGYATTQEMNSAITQSAQQIQSTVNQKITESLEDYSTTTEMNSAITQKANQITSTVSATYATKTALNDTKTTLQSSISQTSTSILSTVSASYATKSSLNSVNNTLTASLELKVNTEDLISEINASADQIKLTAGRLIITSGNFKLDASGNVTASNMNITGGTIKLSSSGNDDTRISVQEGNSSNNKVGIESNRIYIERYGTDYAYMGITEYVNTGGRGGIIDLYDSSGNDTFIEASGILTPKLTQTSLAEEKKNFEKMQDTALDIIKEIDIYKYNLKTEKDTDKKHLGFIIGKKFNYSKEVTSIDNKGVDNYSFTSLCCKAIQELDKRISILEGSE